MKEPDNRIDSFCAWVMRNSPVIFIVFVFIVIVSSL